MKPKKLIIFGTGGSSLDIVDIVLDINEAHDEPVYDLLGFLDDNEATWKAPCRDLPVMGPLSSAMDYEDASFVNGIGSERTFYLKKEFLENTGIPSNRFETLVHPTARVSRTATLGAGTVLHQYVVVENGATLGEHVLILPFTCVGHNAFIGSYTTISMLVCIVGHVNVGHSCYLGASCTVMRNVGEGSLIGMSAASVDEVPPNKIVAGNPGRVLRSVR